MSYNTDAHNSKPNYTRVKSENRSKIDLTVRNLGDICKVSTNFVRLLLEANINI